MRYIITLLFTLSVLTVSAQDVKVQGPKRQQIIKHKSNTPTSSASKLQSQLKTLTFYANGVSFIMCYIKGGSFLMGATPEQGSDAFDDERPVHQVTLNNYYIGKNEVTQELWQAVMGNNPSKFKGNRKPVENISWSDCQDFVTKLSAITGKKFRLPTEAEWEFAARGGIKNHGYKYSGNNAPDNFVWYGSNTYGSTHDVGTKKPNDLGIYDMSGNVAEWCYDGYGEFSSTSQTNPVCSSNEYSYVHRGGGWDSKVIYCRISYRGSSSKDFRFHNLGLRVALSE